MAPITKPQLGLDWFMQSKQPQGGLFGGVFNPSFGTQQTLQPNQTGFGSSFDMSGRYAEAVRQATDLQKQLGLDPKNPMTGAVTLNVMNQILANDPEIMRQQAGIYEGMQNRLADAANERAMKGHIFAGLLNLPNKWQEAMAEKYRFVQPNLEFAKGAAESHSPFLSRQYINI